MINKIFILPRSYKKLIAICVDLFFIQVSFWGAFYIRLGSFEEMYLSYYFYLVVLVSIFTIFIFFRLGYYRSIIRYLNVDSVFSLIFGSGASAIILVLLAYFNNIPLPRSISIIYISLLFSCTGGGRLVVKKLFSQYILRKKENVVIYGAGAAGRQLVHLLRQSGKYNPVAFIDDNKKLQKNILQGLTIYSRQDVSSLIKKYKLNKILLALPSISRSKRRMIFESLIEFPVEVLSIPNLDSILNDNVAIDQLKEVAIEDLLGREPVAPNLDLMRKNIENKVVMITGAGGSIGSELCRQIIKYNPKSILLFELSEFALYSIDKELNELVKKIDITTEIIPLLGSIQRINRLEIIMKTFKVDTLYHAAAYKHVPMVEYNVVEGVRNNIFGTFYTAQAAINAGVSSFVLISTDKAVRPTNVMGATKRMAELGLQALAQQQNLQKGGTQFCMVRFGNVLGSSGSVIPLFKQQIKEGGPITITHPEIIRYFMTIPEAAQLVIQAGAMGKGGDVFVLDMGEPVKIVDLARNLVRLSGLEIKSENNPYGDIELKFTGLRYGEKLFEELLIGENVKTTEHHLIMTAQEEYLPLDKYQSLLDNLDFACNQYDYQQIRQILLEAPIGFQPTDGIEDLVWKRKLVN